MSAAQRGRTITWGGKISETKRAQHVFVKCSIEGCDRERDSGGLCLMHYTRNRRHGDPTVVLPKVYELPPRSGPDSPSWRGNDIGYSAAHVRVQRARGRAQKLGCVDCDEPAAHWSFNHSTPAERTLSSANGPFSGDPADWDPRCVSCHKRYDLSHGESGPVQ